LTLARGSRQYLVEHIKPGKKRMKVVLHATLGKAAIVDRLRAIVGGGLVVADDPASAIAALPDADAFVCTDFFYSAELAAAASSAPRLRLIQLLTAGYDRVAKFGAPAQAAVCNAGAAYAPAVATHAIALLLALQRQIPAILADQPRHAWERGFAPKLTTPAKATAVVIGLGPIGQEIGRLLRAFDANVIGVNRSGAPAACVNETVAISALGEILPRADSIVLALPLSPASRHLIDAHALALCKKSAFIVNIARGAVMDQIALADALKSGVIAGAAVDVTDPEPLPPEHPLWDAPNLILSPHVSGACGPLAGERLAELAGDNLARFMKGEAPRHVVDPGA
jgi:phosphoglycerate dehydrogenase-like enzyme